MRKRQILIVEDEWIVSEDIKCSLVKLGYDVAEIVSSGEEAIRIAEAKIPDLVLIDIKLSGKMDGVATANVITSHYQIPVVFLTAYGDAGMLDRTKAANPFGYIIKPFRDRELYSTIEVALHRSAIETRVERVNAVLRTICNISQLINSQIDRSKLLQDACDEIAKLWGCSWAWIALIDPNGRFLQNFIAGQLANFPLVTERLQKGTPIECMQRALAQKEPAIIDSFTDGCCGCPLLPHSESVKVFGSRLESGGRTYGVLIICIRKYFLEDTDIVSLFQKMAGDIALAIRSLDVAAERNRTMEALTDSKERLLQALNEIKLSQQERLRAERLRALACTANGFIHAFNEVLAPILGFSEILLEKPEVLKDEQQAKSYLGIFRNAALQGAEVVRRLDEFARKRREKVIFHPISLNHLVQECITLTATKWKDQALAKGTTITIETDLGEIPPCVGNALELKDALINLIFNAADAITGRGTISFRTYVDGVWVALQLKDTGIGMTEEEAQHCQEIFFPTKEDSVGLGLPVVCDIVQQHHGEFAIRSQPGRGTTITIRLPPGREVPEGKASVPNMGKVRKLRILVVDDEADVRQFMTIFLTAEGHRVVAGVNGEDALKKFQEGAFDLVITDKVMPVMSGDKLAVAIKALAPAMPVILLTGMGDMIRDDNQCQQVVDFIVTKPVSIHTLREVLRRFGANKT